MTFQSFGSLSGTFSGGVSLAAASATLPYVVVRLEGPCVITPFATLHSEAGTPHASAAACTSITRAVAPPCRTYWCESRIPRLPPVEKSPHTRLRLTLMPGVGYSVVTFDQSHSSSSATIWARPVSVPCPISERAIRITTVSSGLTTTQAFTSGAAPCARTALLPKGRFRPRASPPPTVAVLTRKERRSIFRVVEIMAAPLCLGGSVDGLTHLLEGAAAANVGDPRVDVGVGRRGLVLEERRHRHDHARLTVAALRDLVLEPGLLNLVQDSIGGQAF